METVACDLCGSIRHTVVYEMPDRRYFPDEFFTVVQCSVCGLGFVNPRPTFEEILKYYPPEYYQEEFTRDLEYHARRYAREAAYLGEIEKRGGPRSLLDVGCANGDFPRFMKARGWEVEGLEVSRSASPIDDFNVYTQFFPDIPVDEPRYDAITAWALLEHVHTPMAYFKKASRLLRPGGLFVFLVTNFHSLASRHLFCEDIPRHLYFFSRETVQQYLEGTGFKMERERNGRDVFSMPPANWLIYFIKTSINRETFSCRDLPLTRPDFIRCQRLQPSVLSTVKFAVENPLKALDRALWPAVETLQILRRSYGISTFVARKL